MPHTLRPSQVAALAYARNRQRIALFMEMRLGKSVVAIRWAKAHKAKRVLIVSPLGPIYDWKEELKTEGVPPYDIIDLTRLDLRHRTELAYGGASGFFLLNYEALRTDFELPDFGWDAIILDESTRIRNPKAQITKRILHDWRHVPCKAILSGLPRPESELDYFCQFQFLEGGFLGFHNYWVFRNKKFKQDPELDWLRTPVPGLRDEIKEYLHRHAFVLTRKQAGLGNVRVYERRVVVPSRKQIQAQKEVLKKFSYEYIETNFATVRDVWMARVAGGFSPDRENPELLGDGKFRELLDLLIGELQRQQVVVWFRFNEELDEAVRRIRKAKIPCDFLNGSVPKDKRDAIRDRFRQKHLRVLCVQLNVGRFGLNLAGASAAIYFSNVYEWEARAQSEDRIENVDKKEPLLFIDLITEGSIDLAVVNGLREKKRNARQFMTRLARFVAEEWKKAHASQTRASSGSGKALRASRVTRRYASLPMPLRVSE